MSNPLFLADLDAMKAELRLSGVPATGEDANVILEDVLLQVRTAFYRRLGITRVGQIVAFATNYTNPTTNDELLRAVAKSTEVKMTWCKLAERLPQLAEGADTVVDCLVDLPFGDGVAHAHVHSLALLPEFGPVVRVGIYLVRISLPLRVARRTYCVPSCSIVIARFPPSSSPLFRVGEGPQPGPLSPAPSVAADGWRAWWLGSISIILRVVKNKNDSH